MDRLKEKVALRAQAILRKQFGEIDSCREKVARISSLETAVTVFPKGESMRFFVVKVREMLL